MIPYIEVRDKYTIQAMAMVEPQECWFELSWQEVGAFELYCRATQTNLKALQKGRFVTIPNKPYIWVITAVRYTFTAGGARMISATGYEAKWLLKKRCILTPKELQGNITSAIYGLVNENLGTTAEEERAITGFTVDNEDILIDISGAQAQRGNLLEFVNALLKQYNCGSTVELINGELKYRLYAGEVLTHKVKFSQSLDNLLSSEYYTNEEDLANYALVVSSFDEAEQKHKKDYMQEVGNGASGIDRAEIVINSNLSTKYVDESGAEKDTTPDSELYQGWQQAEGELRLAEHITIEDIKGEIDLVNSIYEFAKDFFVGDMVKIQDEYFNFFVNTRITKYTFKQDANGYGEEAEYGR